MKKTNSMRVAAAMLALTLITSCFAGGTFAKYTTSASGNDSARVAKFGVEVEAGKSAFLKEYDANDDEYTAGYTVASSENVVAPGTSGTIDLFKISGTPEVAVRVDVKMSDIKSVYLKKDPVITFAVSLKDWEEEQHTIEQINGEWVDTVKPIPNDQEELARIYQQQLDEYDGWGDPKKAVYIESEIPGVDYYPIEWTLIKDGDTENPVKTGKLEDIQAYFDGINGAEFEPGTNLAEVIEGSYTLKWKWDFSGNDECDTTLGNIAAGTETYAADKYNLEESFKFTITVTQID